MDHVTILLAIAIIEGIIILRGLLELSRQIDHGLEDLNMGLAEAIKSVVENFAGSVGLGEGFEPPNPIQQAIAGFIQNKMNESNAIEIVNRSTDGKFSSDTK
jgi:hypothetical protein